MNSKCIDEDTLNSVINRYLKRRNYTTPNQSLISDNKFTIRESIANEFVLNYGSYDHLIGFANSNKLDYFNNCNKCLDEFLNFLDKLNLDNENRLSFSFSIFIHLFIDLFINEFKQEAKQFFNDNQHKFSCFNQFKKTVDMLSNSIKNQQLDKRLIKLRSSKISIALSESDHRLLLEFLENESFSKNLHQIINQNFTFSLSPDKDCDRSIKKLSSTNSMIDYSVKSEDQTTKFKEFNNLFMCNGKLPANSEKMNEINEKMEISCKDENSSSNSLLNDQNGSSLREEDQLELEFNELKNNLKLVAPQLPQILTYKLSTNDSHICCADLRQDLRYCCAGTENSEVLVFQNTDLRPSYDLSTSKWLAGDEKASLIEEKVDKTQNDRKPFSFYGHHNSVVDLKFVPNSNYLLTCSNDSNSILWDLNEKETANYLKKKYYGHTQPVYSLDVNCLGTHFATGSKDYTSRLFSLDRSNLLRSFVGHQNSINCVHFHPNSKYLATGSSDHSIRMWDIALSSMVRVFNCQTEIYSLCYSTDGQWLASAGADRKIKIWDLTNGKLLIEFNSSHTQPVNSLSFNSTSTVLISSSIDQQINFWNFKTFKQDAFRSEETVEPLLTSKNLLIKIRRAKFTHSDLLVAVGT